MPGPRPHRRRHARSRDGDDLPGETLLAYTDGVTEARSEAGGFFDEERRLALLDEPAPSAAALLDRIEHAVDASAAETASDDLTLMAVRRGPR